MGASATAARLRGGRRGRAPALRAAGGAAVPWRRPAGGGRDWRRGARSLRSRQGRDLEVW